MDSSDIIESGTIAVENGQRNGLGKQLEETMSQLSANQLPPELSVSSGAAGRLATNEDMSDDLMNEIRSSEHAPDGYIFGVGFGNILTMVELFPEGVEPKAIVSCDVLPEVVFAGRVFRSLLAESEEFGVLLRACIDEDRVQRAIDSVFQNEGNEEIRSRLQKVDHKVTMKALRGFACEGTMLRYYRGITEKE